RIDHWFDPTGQARLDAAAVGDADDGDAGRLNLRRRQGDEALTAFARLFGAATFGFTLSRRRIGCWLLHREVEAAAAKQPQGRDPADQEGLVESTPSHQRAPWKGTRPSWRARSISARTRARRASTAAV